LKGKVGSRELFGLWQIPKEASRRCGGQERVNAARHVPTAEAREGTKLYSQKACHLKAKEIGSKAHVIGAVVAKLGRCSR